MRRVAALIAVVLSTACSTAPSPPAQPPGTSSVTANTVSASPTSSACHLPVVVRRFDPAARTWSPDTSGFLTYPAGEFTTAGATGVRYDASRRVWLPNGVPTPGGAGYVYADSAGAIQVTTIDSGLDRAVVSGSWVPLGFVGDSLYVAEAKPIPPSTFAGGGYTEGGVYRTDLSGAKPAAITEHPGPWWLSSLGAWTADRADGLQQAPDRVLHLDLQTGAVTPWLSGVGN